MIQDKKYKRDDLVFFQTSEISWYGRVILNHPEYLKLDISDRCRSCIRRVSWNKIKSIRPAQQFELEDL